MLSLVACAAATVADPPFSSAHRRLRARTGARATCVLHWGSPRCATEHRPPTVSRTASANALRRDGPCMRASAWVHLARRGARWATAAYSSSCPRRHRAARSSSQRACSRPRQCCVAARESPRVCPVAAVVRRALRRRCRRWGSLPSMLPIRPLSPRRTTRAAAHRKGCDTGTTQHRQSRAVWDSMPHGNVAMPAPPGHHTAPDRALGTMPRAGEASAAIYNAPKLAHALWRLGGGSGIEIPAGWRGKARTGRCTLIGKARSMSVP